jgi:uncharacterized membrane protein
MANEKKEEVKGGMTWRAAEYEHYDKSTAWYVVNGVVAAAIIGYALYQKNFFFAVFIVIAFIMLMFFSRRRPEVFDFRVDESGIGVGRSSYNYESIENFSMRSRLGRLDELILKRKVSMNPIVKIPIDSKLAGEVKEFLGGKLPEIEYEESLLDTFAEWFGF